MRRAWKSLLAFVCLAMATPAMAATTYTWNQIGSAAWTTSTNWTPTRTTPAADDILVFNGGGAVTATAVPTQTIGQLQISNSTSVTLQAGGAVTLTIAGDAGTDLDVPAGSTLQMNAASAITFALTAPATGSVGGTVNITTGAHRITALGAGAIHFLNGSLVTVGTGFSGNLFGTGAGTSALNSVVFESGSIYAQSAGSNPFGAAQPNSVVTFLAGSRYRLDGAITPSLSGRTYADFEHNTTGPTSTTGGNPLSIDNLIVTQGALNLGMTGTFNLKGNITAAGGTNLSFNPASPATVTFNGSAPQIITASGAVSANANTTYEINNAAGLQLATNFAIVNTLKFTSGNLSTGIHQVNLGTSTIITGASQATGWIDGTASWLVPSGSSVRTFPVGDATTYAPIDLTLNGAGSSFPIVARAPGGDHPQVFTSGLAPASSVNRSYTLNVSGSPSFTNFDAIFNFAPADLDGPADPNTFEVKRWDGASWNPTTVGIRTATSTQIVGQTVFGEFAIGNLPGGGPVTNTDTGLSYPTIQQCLDDPLTHDFHVIHIAAGTYTEQVEIKKGVFIHGDGCGQTIIKSPAVLALSYGAGPKKPVVWVHDTDAHLSSLTIDGDGQGNANYQFIGVSFWNASGGLHQVCVTNIEETPFSGVQHGVGIHADNSGGGPYNLVVEASSVDEFQKNGMALSGDNLTVNVNNCTVTGKGPTAITAQNGIQVGFGAGGVVYGNLIKDLSFTPATFVASGLLAFEGANLYAAGTEFTNVQAPVSWYDTEGTMDSLHTTGGADYGPVFVYNSSAGPSPSRGGVSAGRTHSTAQPFGARAMDEARRRDGTLATYNVSVVQSCFAGVDASGSVGVFAYSEGGPLNVNVQHCELSHWDEGLATFGAATTLTANENSIHDNVTAGYDNAAGIAQDAESNWWGAADGPGGAGPGSGDAIVGLNVDAVPFLTSGADYDPACGFVGNPPPSVTVLSPNGGESLIISSNAKLAWSASDDLDVTSVDLYVSRTGPGGPFTLIASGEANDGTYSWIVTGPTTSDAYLKVVAHDVASETVDLSDAAFNIDDKTATVLALFTAEPTEGGIQVRWKFSDASEIAETWVERAATTAGPWLRLDTAPQRDGDAMVVLDGAAEAGRTYQYRLVANVVGGATQTFGPITGTAGDRPGEFALARIAPNPTPSKASIDYTVARVAHVRLSVVDLQGRTVSTLVDGMRAPGRYTATWTGEGSRGRLAAGVYFVRYEAEGRKYVGRVLLTP